MSIPETSIDSLEIAPRTQVLFEAHLDEVHRQRDRTFAWLMVVQWVFGIAIAEAVSPLTWSGRVASTHLHVYYAIFLGGALSVPVLLLARYRPGTALTRYTVAVAQMLWSGLLIHLTGGRIETHFHVFGSLAFLAFYRDWRVLLLGTLVIASDHFLRGLYWPASVYGVTNPQWWRFLEHGTWILFEDVVLLMGIAENLREMRAIASTRAAMEQVNVTIERKVIERTAELESSREQFRALVERTHTIPLQLDTASLNVLYVGPQAETFLGRPVTDWYHPAFLAEAIHLDDQSALGERLKLVRPGQEVELRLRHADGSWKWARAILSSSAEGSSIFHGLLLDITDRRALEVELQQAQKLEAVGQLASGIAHEINTPIQFVSDSLQFIREAFRDTLALVGHYQRLIGQLASQALSVDHLAQLREVEDAADLTYISQQVPKALERSAEGLDRVAMLVRSLREFAHPGEKTKVRGDVNHALSTTLTIASNEYKYVADVVTDFGDIPPLLCHLNELNQSFLNIIVNAAHAIAAVVEGTNDRGLIRVATRRDGDQILVSIADTGGGIPETIRDKIFDPFFTTKPIGKGSGQGLAIARSMVVDKHGGTISVETESGRGTTFVIRLPLDNQGTEPALLPAVAA